MVINPPNKQQQSLFQSLSLFTLYNQATVSATLQYVTTQLL